MSLIHRIFKKSREANRLQLIELIYAMALNRKPDGAVISAFAESSFNEEATVKFLEGIFRSDEYAELRQRSEAALNGYRQDEGLSRQVQELKGEMGFGYEIEIILARMTLVAPKYCVPLEGKIPKILHFIWIGDEARRPDKSINKWRELNPDYEIKVWGNDALNNHPWINIAHIKSIYDVEICGAADIMRYEILYKYGGIFLDADLIPIRAFEDWLIEPTEFSCWENELMSPGLIANGIMGSMPKSNFLKAIIDAISAMETVTHDVAWKTVGPALLTKMWKLTKFPLTVYPSHYFLPNHRTGHKYLGSGTIFSDHIWQSTFDEERNKRLAHLINKSI